MKRDKKFVVAKVTMATIMNMSRHAAAVESYIMVKHDKKMYSENNELESEGLSESSKNP